MSRIISLCFSCFALGVSFTSLLWVFSDYKKGDEEMRLGEFRTKTRDFENKLMLRLSVYDVIEHNENGYVELDIDMVTDDVVYLRMINDDYDD